MNKNSKYKVTLICGILFNPTWCKEKFANVNTVEKINSIIVDAFKTVGIKSIALQSEMIKFDFTSYYNDEMGEEILRYWICFTPGIELATPYKIKLMSIRLEQEHFSDEQHNRKVNIDPGYIEGSKLVLFSTKNYSHRIYLGKGIFAEVTLIYKHGKFEILPWTYPDYKTDVAIKFFTQVRSLWCGEQ